MYALVNDVEAYPQFLPWCSGAQVLACDEREMRAVVHVAKSGIRKSFTTHNQLHKNRVIEMRMIDGPFKHLQGEWAFKPLDDGCKVSLDLDFAFSNRFVALTIGPVFNTILSALVDAFVKRAHCVYVE